MKRIIIYKSKCNQGAFSSHVVTYPKGYTDEQITEDFNNSTMGFELVAICLYSEVDRSYLIPDKFPTNSN